MSSLSILVLAAGAGSRMKSALPKVLHLLSGKPLLEHVLETVFALKPKGVGVVVGVGRDEVKRTMEQNGRKRLTYIVQDKPKGSGHAVQKALPWLRRQKGTLLVVYGDTPLLTAATLKHLVDAHEASENSATFLAMDVPNPAGYGRMIVRGADQLERIVEHRDATEDEKRVTLVNSGVACWNSAQLAAVLPLLRPNNAKHEYYLTDAVALLRERRLRVGVMTAEVSTETQGINTRADLAEAEAVCRRRILDHWMREGVTIVDPGSTFIDANAVIGADTRLWPGTIIQGPCRIGSRCEILPYSVIEHSVVKDGVRIGPFAHLRPESFIEENAHIGNFVEIKKSRMRAGSKANHLTYIGDSDIGARTNVGAGTITCNYDGVAKHPTKVDADVFIGSNTNLVAPIHVGRGAMIAAGSTVTEDVPADSLAVARSRQMIKRHWVKGWFQKRKRGRS